jgi:hypothetical protein
MNVDISLVNENIVQQRPKKSTNIESVSMRVYSQHFVVNSLIFYQVYEEKFLIIAKNFVVKKRP